ncbi:sigma 54-interacting transcriptional regulator, partial [Burkholderia gladioli]|nr:sigma 54-interacting transcriptional regulator [Burkholderia gladioli]
GPFLAINCGAIAANLVESEMFGHDRGSFTGADRQHKGFFERADGGTLFLDEITEMPVESQVKLLRVLETGRLTRLGSAREIDVDVRIVAATNLDPEAAMANGKLRPDLYHRINVFPITLPPLRERGDDIPMLAAAFLTRLNEESGRDMRFAPAALAALAGYEWPGNVRELRNTIERAFILADHDIDLDLPRQLPPRADVRDNVMSLPLGATLAHAQQRFIVASLRHFEGDKPRTAKALGISLKTLYNRLALMRDHGLQNELDDSARR